MMRSLLAAQALAIAVAVLLVSADPATAQFATVIDIPPQPDIGDHGGIGSGTQLNLHGAGKIGLSFDVGAPNVTNSNVELNVKGGTVGNELQANPGSVTNVTAGIVGSQLSALAGSTVNISGGSVGNNLAALAGSEVNIAGGTVGNNLAAFASEVNISGGTVGSDLIAHTDSVVNISGGVVGAFLDAGLADGSSSNIELNISGGFVNGGINVWKGSVTEITGGILGWIFGSGGDSFNAQFMSIVHAYGGTVDFDFDTFAGSDVNIYGSDFELDGEPLGVGAALQIDIPAGSILTGVLSDGTPFALGTPLSDEIAIDTLTLHNATLPPVEPTTINVPTDIAPPSIRGNQTLTVGPGGVIGNFFRAGAGSTLVVAGGTVGQEAQVAGATVTISSGIVRDSLAAIEGSTVNMTGGRLGAFAHLGRGSVMIVSGGSVDIGFRAQSGSQLNITGGSIGGFFSAEFGSEVNLSGGSTGINFGATSGSEFNITGGEFRLNGAPIAGLETVGSSLQLNLPAGNVLSGTLADGTPFAFSEQAGDFIADGVLTLRAATLPLVGPAMIHVPTDSPPRGIREGQTLTLSEGGQLGQYFVAGPGSILVITGGTGGGDMEAVGATVNISGGNTSNLGAFAGSQIRISGGTVSGLRAYSGSEVNIMGGMVSRIEAKDGSTVIISDGTVIGNSFSRPILVDPGSEVNISGGTIDGGNIFVASGAMANISGGIFNSNFQAGIGSQVNLVGTQFLLGGQQIAGLVLDEPFTITGRNVTLTGVLADGSAFSFDLNSTLAFNMDWFLPEAVLTVTLVESASLPGDYDGSGKVDAADYVVWRNALDQMSPNLAADGNGDGIINQADYGVWRAHFGQTAVAATAGSAGYAIPEPGTLCVMLLGTLAVVLTVRRTNPKRKRG